jgi:hypothetical protein
MRIKRKPCSTKNTGSTFAQGEERKFQNSSNLAIGGKIGRRFDAWVKFLSHLTLLVHM